MVKRPYSKYHNIRTSVGKDTFDSKVEARHWQTLQLRALAGEITNLQRQVRYDLECNGVYIGFYKSDAEYDDADGNHVVLDVKGSRRTVTALYKWKKKMVKAQYNVDIMEVYDV